MAVEIAMLKHYIKIGNSVNFCVFVVERKEKGKKKLEFLDLVVFVQKWPFRDAKLFSKKWVAETLAKL